ncbi:hypothetical protein E8E12_007449 [Didymella heteroderae]|uniref:Uncharacterized protein n=1 Tax=Didymella heteroderae TaxID=1769908 RepID=A0A9P4WTU2_9PLEO|nr:hypothetical protein E8E12_007449 [Didymella heteroderae]
MLPERATRRTFKDNPLAQSQPFLYIILPSLLCIAAGWLIMYSTYRRNSNIDNKSKDVWMRVFEINIGFVLAMVGFYGLWLWIQTWEEESKAAVAGEVDHDEKKEDMAMQGEKQRARALSYYGALTE